MTRAFRRGDLAAINVCSMLWNDNPRQSRKLRMLRNGQLVLIVSDPYKSWRVWAADGCAIGVISLDMCDAGYVFVEDLKLVCTQ